MIDTNALFCVVLSLVSLVPGSHVYRHVHVRVATWSNNIKKIATLRNKTYSTFSRSSIGLFHSARGRVEPDAAVPLPTAVSTVHCFRMEWAKMYFIEYFNNIKGKQFVFGLRNSGNGA